MATEIDLPSVQHFIMCKDIKVKPPVGINNPYDLIGVNHIYRVPAKFGMSLGEPKPAKPAKFFCRFYGGKGTIDFEITVWYDNTPVGDFGPFTVNFRDGEPVRDFVFTLRNIPLSGVGVYEVRLSPLTGTSEKIIALEYFEVVQS